MSDATLVPMTTTPSSKRISFVPDRRPPPFPTKPPFRGFDKMVKSKPPKTVHGIPREQLTALRNGIGANKTPEEHLAWWKREYRESSRQTTCYYAC